MKNLYGRRRLLQMACTSLVGSSLAGESLAAKEVPEAEEHKPSDYVFAPAPVCSLAVAGSNKRFPIRRIFGIGVNYPVSGASPERARLLEKLSADRIIIFDKFRDSIVEDGADIPYPQGTTSLVHEVELVVAIGKAAIDVDADRALAHVFGYAVGNDLTRGDLMKAARESGGAVDAGKAFDGSAPCGPIHPVSSVGHLKQARMWLTVDGDLRQEGDVKDMLKRPAVLISALSHLYQLRPGDVIYTGTPYPPGSVERNQTMVCGIDGLGTLTNKIV